MCQIIHTTRDDGTQLSPAERAATVRHLGTMTEAEEYIQTHSLTIQTCDNLMV
jgi:hypothetical protein